MSCFIQSIGLTQTWTTLSRPTDPDKSVDGGWTAAAPDIVGNETYPYLQYQFLSSNTKMQLKIRVEKAPPKQLDLKSANTLFDLDGDGVPEFALILSITQKNGYKENDAADYNPTTGQVTNDTTSYTYKAYFLTLDDDGSADANTRPNNTTIRSSPDFLIYDSDADQSDNTSSVATAGNAYNSSLDIKYALAPETDLDGDGTTENYYTLQFDLQAYTNFVNSNSSSTGIQALVASWPTSSQFFAATVSSTQDNSVNGDIGGGGFGGDETWGEITGSSPEINVNGNSVTIPDGDTTPTTTDHTDFGDAQVTGGTVTRTFTIENLGLDKVLTLGSNAVSVTGDFSVAQQPATSVAASSTTTFQITFDPTTTGTRTGTISINSNDSDENPYNFSIQGNGINTNSPPTSTNDTITTNEDTTATLASTDFGTYADGDGDAFAGVKITTLET
ncbi:MAG: choice-of-anchor D domain-containing protein, partial [Verrucomicrobia bacterium]|nr:choice-of-anchor D domain-containing protein [Verrucomicrobiota bacterium]